MPLNADTLFVAGIALAALTLIGLLAGLWRGVLTRRRLRDTRLMLKEREAELRVALALARVPPDQVPAMARTRPRTLRAGLP